MSETIEIRRDTAADWASANPTLTSGELAFETDTRKIQIGDGSTVYLSLTNWLLQAANNLSELADMGTARFNVHVPELTPAAAVAVVNVSLAAPGASADGYSFASGDLYLLTAQTTSSQKGLWKWNGAAAVMTRLTEFPSGGVVNGGRTCAVKNGSTYGASIWVLNTPTAGITIDTSAQTWTEATGSSGSPGNLTGPITSTGLATAIGAQTGTGSTFVMAAAPTITSAVLVTPALGTPASGVATNLTGTAAGLTAGGNNVIASNGSDINNVGTFRYNSKVPELTPAAAVGVANVTISGPGATLDGYSLAAGDYVLLTGQTTSSQNGLWAWNGAASALTRVTEFPSAGVVNGRLCAVKNGTLYKATVWLLQAPTAGITIDTTAQTWLQATGGSTSLIGLTPATISTNTTIASGKNVYDYQLNANSLVITLRAPTGNGDIIFLTVYQGSTGGFNYSLAGATGAAVYASGATLSVTTSALASDTYVCVPNYAGTDWIIFPSAADVAGYLATATYDPAAIAQQVVGTTATQTLTNKTLTSPTLTTPVISTITNTGTVTLPTATDTLVGRATTDVLTNKRVTKRVSALSANSATPALNTDNFDALHITAQTTAITSFTSSLTGSTHNDGDTLRISVTGTASVSLTFGASFEGSTIALPSTTSGTTRLDMGFIWNTETTKWRCVGVA